MDIGRAFSYVFEDKDWVGKLVVLGMLTLFAGIPLLGLFPLAIVIGYMVQLVDNVRNGAPRPLPKWDSYGDQMTLGAGVLVALLVYNIPLLVVGGCSMTLVFTGGNDFISGVVGLVLLCCIVPLLLIYTLLIWPLLAIGTIRYAASHNSAVFYQFGDLIETARSQSGPTFSWMVAVFVVNLIFGVVGAIPCIGWVAALGLTIPVHGHLLGQYGLEIGRKPKKKWG